MGSKKRPFYRIIAAASISKRDGKFLDIVGLYHPVAAEGQQVRLDVEKIKSWLNKGAQPTDSVKNILSREGIWSGFAQEREQRRVKKVVKKRRNKKNKSQQATASSTSVSETPQT